MAEGLGRCKVSVLLRAVGKWRMEWKAQEGFCCLSACFVLGPFGPVNVPLTSLFDFVSPSHCESFFLWYISTTKKHHRTSKVEVVASADFHAEEQVIDSTASGAS
jgi:hypothetical protein